MKKTLAALALSLVMLLSLSACKMYSDLAITISKDGSGTMDIISAVDQELLDALSEAGDEGTLYAIDYNGETVYGYIYSVEFSSYDDLVTLLTDKDAFSEAAGGEAGYPVFDSLTVSKRGISGTINSHFASASMEDMELEQEQLETLISSKITFTFETEIAETNGTLSEDGKSVTYDLMKDTEVSTKLKSNLLLYIGIGAGAAVLCAGVIVIIIMLGKKKKAAEAPAEFDVPAEATDFAEAFESAESPEAMEAAEAAEATEAAPADENTLS